MLIEKIKTKFDFIFKLNDLFDRKEKIEFLAVIFAALFTAFFQALSIASILPFINMVMDPSVIHSNHWLGYLFDTLDFKTERSFMVASGFGVLGLLIISNLVSALASWLKIGFVWRKSHKLSRHLLEKYLSMPYAYFLDKNTSELGKNVLAEIQQLTSNFFTPLTKIITDILLTIVIIILLFYVNFLITLAAIVTLSFTYFLIYIHLAEKLKRVGKKQIEENTGRYKSAYEALSGIKDIKILGTEDFFLERFSKHSSKYSHIQSWHKLSSELPRYFMEIVAFGGIVALLIFLVSSNIPTQKIIPLISLFAFAGYRLMPALQEIFSSLACLKFNKAVLDKIHKDVTQHAICKSDKITVEKIRPIYFKNEIYLRGVYFSYPNTKKPALSDINLKIKKNSFAALIGTTGAGKTTLADLLLGLLIPDKGQFGVDNAEINSDNIKNWQANLGYVPQQIYLSDDTVARNIAFGLTDEKINIEQVKRAAQMANLSDFIDVELSKGYDTVIGERGIRLSGGQKQRIGIARALYRDPQVLIFDEATSSLDNATEKEVLSAIENVAKTKTMIVIAHRLTTVKNADVVYKIEKGMIVGKGTYAEMVENNQ